MTLTNKYLIEATQTEIERLRRQSEVFATEARRWFDRMGIQPGWRAMDVGCGPVGVLEILADRVGPEGSVVGLDSSTLMVEQARAFVAATGRTNIEIVHADAVATGLPRASFDLVHERLVVTNLARPEGVISEMVALCKPGGIVALQDIDTVSWLCEPMHPAWQKLHDALLALGVRAGRDPSIGRRLPALLREAGLVDIEADARVWFCDKNNDLRFLIVHATEAVRGPLTQAGVLRADEIDNLKAELKVHLDEPNTLVLSPILAQVWGRRPL